MSTRYLFLALGALALFSPLSHAQQIANKPPATNSAPAAATAPVDPSSHAMATAIGMMNTNNVEGALAKLTEAIKLNPSNSAAYVLRASIYCQKQQWPQAEQDFKTAAQLSPTNVVLQLNLVEVKFMQKQYDAARAGFAAFVKDPDMGDFAAYKVFLCDLFGGHEAAAKKELDAFNKADENPSYYFSNAAWDLTHKDIEGARSWLVSASHIYPVSKNGYYAKSLRDLGYLPIPEPTPAK